MKFNITEVIKDYDGSDLYDEKLVRGELVKEEDPKTFRDVVSLCTRATLQDETPEDKNKLFPIGIKIWGSDDVDLTAEQIALVIKRVEKLYNALVLGRCREFFDSPLLEDRKDKTPEEAV